jgi:hypothetical protein
MWFPQCESVSLLSGLTGLLHSPGEVNLQFAQASRVPVVILVSAIRLFVYSPTHLFLV